MPELEDPPLFSQNQATGRISVKVAMSVAQCMLYVVPYFAYILKFLILPFTKVLGQNYQLQKDALYKSNEKEVVSEFTLWAQKWNKMALREKCVFLVFVNHPVVHSGGVSRGESVALAVGVSDM